MRCEWVSDYTERKATLYAIWERLLGRYLKCEEAVRM